MAIWRSGGLEARCRPGDVGVLMEMERGRRRATRMQVCKQKEVNNATGAPV